jgi:maleylacetate reductase
MSSVFQELPRDRVVFSAKAADALQGELAKRGAQRVLGLVSATLGKAGAPGAAVLDSLGEAIVARYDGLSEHTPLGRVLEAAALAREHQVDALVAIGGGSVIDGAKAVKAALLADLRTPEDFGRWSKPGSGLSGMAVGGPPLIAVPTTISAAEYTPRSGYTNPLTGLKEGVRAVSLTPATVILDPWLCVATPTELWTSTGIRSVDHAVEGIFSVEAWPGLQAQAATGLRMLVKGLKDSFADPSDPAARSIAQQGVWLIAPMCDRMPMGASHGLGYLLGTMGGVPHGKTSCVLLPAVVAWNASTRPEAAALVAETLGVRDPSEGVRALIAGLGLPTRIRDLGVDKSVLDRMAEAGPGHRVVRSNPRPLATTGDVRALLETAW